ncbi:conserved hypothetical protein [uncultured Desulfatiglans sp.]|nr:conserved hypothetical protein [uncultured Desulfatiglans sp.]
MLIQPDCIPCILKMAVYVMRALQFDKDESRVLYGRIAALPSLQGGRWNYTSPEIIEQVMDIILQARQEEDPFHAIKRTQNQMIMDVVPYLETLVREDPNPLLTAVKLAILGNNIDFMVGENPPDIKHLIREKLQAPIPPERFGRLEEGLSRAKRMVYFADNAGEIVFDRVLIGILKERFDADITLVVRQRPTLNDTTLEEARAVGIDALVPVIPNGMDGPFPGTRLERCSAEVNTLVEEADLILSKGGGNYDSLSEEREDVTRKIAYLLVSKCYPYYEEFGVPLFQPVLETFTGRKHPSSIDI